MKGTILSTALGLHGSQGAPGAAPPHHQISPPPPMQEPPSSPSPSPAAAMPPPPPSAPISKVVLSGMALLKIIKHATDMLPELCVGNLVGIDDDQGTVEVSDSFGLPSPPPLMEGEGEEEAHTLMEQEVAEFQQDMMRLLRDANGDDNCVGWYRSVNMGDWCNADFIEQQYAQQEELDTGGVARSVLIMYDPYQIGGGRLAIKAIRLTDAFMEIMRTRSSPDARLAVSTDAALSRFLNSDVFYEIPIEIENSPLAQAVLFDLHPSLDLRRIAYGDLVIPGDSKLEKNVAFIVEELDRLQRERLATGNHARNVQNQKAQQTKFIAERKLENVSRAARGEEPLPLKDLSLEIFKPIRDPTKLNSLLIRKQVDVYCDQVFSFAADAFELQFLRGAVQPQ